MISTKSDARDEPPLRIAKYELAQRLQLIFVRHGMSSDDAGIVADVLVWAELQGRSGHGAVRTARYVEMIRDGEIDPRAVPEVIRQLPATILMDAHSAAGPVALLRGVEAAILQAKQQGGCFALVRRTTHTGALGYFARRAAEQGLVSIVVAAGKPLMAYHGAAVPSASTSPIAIAIPARSGPIVLDMATSVASLGKLRQLAVIDAAIPDDWALTQDARPTRRASEAAIPLPVGGAKGSGLALMFEALSGVLGGWPVLAPSLGADAITGLGQNALVMTMDVEAFGDREAFLDNVDDLASKIRALPPREGFNAVSLPGDRSRATEADRSSNGIPMRKALWQELQSLLDGP